jgi:hypothetical protein
LDIWTSHNVVAFLAITMHYIDQDWNLKEKLLDFIDLKGPHSGENLCDAFTKSCIEYGILNKVIIYIFIFLYFLFVYLFTNIIILILNLFIN